MIQIYLGPSFLTEIKPTEKKIESRYGKKVQRPNNIIKVTGDCYV